MTADMWTGAQVVEAVQLPEHLSRNDLGYPTVRCRWLQQRYSRYSCCQYWGRASQTIAGIAATFDRADSVCQTAVDEVT